MLTQKGLAQSRAAEIETVKKSLSVYKSIVEEIDERFGGMNAVDE